MRGMVQIRAKKIGMISLGCAKNLVNSEQMMFLLKSAGYKVTGDTSDVDAVVLNTCGFIESAKEEAIESVLELGKAKEEGRVKKLIVAGCLPQRYKDEILSELPEIDAVVGTGSFEDIVDAVKSVFTDDKKVSFFDDISAAISETDRIITTSAAWAYIKVAEGCDNHCAFCIIPNIRGKFRSRPMENIISEAEKLAERGVKELILVAQDVTRYGTDIYGESKLVDLLDNMSKIEKIQWLRLHYLYPDEITENLIEAIAGNDKILKYMDIPIQHINNDILRNMNRRGTGDEIRALFSSLREKIDGVVLRTSVITGLPGEGEEEFTQLAEFLLDAKIERAGVFRYSPEEGTKAAKMERPPQHESKRRAELLENIQMQIMDNFAQSRIGQITKILVEGYENGRFYGRTYAESPDIDGYVTIIGKDIAHGAFYNIRIISVEDGQPLGRII